MLSLIRELLDFISMLLDRPKTADAQLVQLGAQLRQRRLALRLTQEALGRQAQVHRTLIGHIEGDGAACTVLTLTRLADALELELVLQLKEPS
jgi:transcriptional regulator with XRE-family HTH domain